MNIGAVKEAGNNHLLVPDMRKIQQPTSITPTRHILVGRRLNKCCGDGPGTYLAQEGTVIVCPNCRDSSPWLNEGNRLLGTLVASSISFVSLIVGVKGRATPTDHGAKTRNTTRGYQAGE